VLGSLECPRGFLGTADERRGIVTGWLVNWVAGETIRGDRVVLRPTTGDDLSFLRTFFADPDVYEHWGGSPLGDAEITSKYLGRRSPEVECFIVENEGRSVGYVQYHVADDGGEGGGMDLVLLPASRGCGVGTAVANLVIEYVQSRLGWRRFTVDPGTDNVRGVEFWTKVGFKPVRLVEGDGGRNPYWLMEWPTRKETWRGPMAGS
jgi:aminoglycoside 6'-N-acetyltransferase